MEGTIKWHVLINQGRTNKIEKNTTRFAVTSNEEINGERKYLLPGRSMTRFISGTELDS